MNCREFVEFLMAYLDEDLSPAERDVFRQHIRDCPPCGTYLDTYRETVRMGGALCRGDDPVPDDVPEELVAAILAAREERRRP